MEKFIKVSFLVLIQLLLFSNCSFSQNFSESDIQDLAEKINKQIKGIDIGNGVTARGCLSAGRTLLYQYDVPEHWESPENIKKELIANFKTIGSAKNFYLYNINVSLFYFKANTIVKKVDIKSNELSTFTFELGEYISIKKHKKAKGVNLKIKAPIDWKVEEGNGPNIVKKFTYDNSMYLILIKDLATFISRNQSKELLEDREYVNSFAEESISYLTNPELLSTKVMTVESYPTIEIKYKGTHEKLGMTIPVIGKTWCIFYEDKFITLQATGINNIEFKALEQLYLLITNSVTFPDQYK